MVSQLGNSRLYQSTKQKNINISSERPVRKSSLQRCVYSTSNLRWTGLLLMFFAFVQENDMIVSLQCTGATSMNNHAEVKTDGTSSVQLLLLFMNWIQWYSNTSTYIMIIT